MKLAALRSLSATGWRRRALVGVIVAGTLGLAYYGWFRNSSFVAVRDVKVEGVSAERGQIVAALTDAARGMTTLHLQPGRLESAVHRFPTVASVSADPSFPHGLTIQVTEREPVLIASDGSRQLPVAADGLLLPGAHVDPERLPELEVQSLPASGRLSRDSLPEALTLGAAPAPLRPLIDGLAVTSDYGIVVTMRGGVELRFGTGTGADAKWAAATAILADPSLSSLSYIDVRVPTRPAVGGTSEPSPAATSATTPSTTTTTPP